MSSISSNFGVLALVCMPQIAESYPRQVFVVGGGIAGLAVAALLIRDGRVAGNKIRVFEQSARWGGSLDGAGTADAGYVIRGGRMFEPHFACTFDLFSQIPSLTDIKTSVTDEIQAFTQQVVTSSKARLVSAGIKLEAPPLGLSLRDKINLGLLLWRSETGLGMDTIENYFGHAFLTTNFWYLWCSMFAFQPWHSLAEFRRYLRRFMHLMPGFNRLEGIYRTPLNQYDSLVMPLLAWLRAQGVSLESHTKVCDLHFVDSDRGAGPPKSVSLIDLENPSGPQSVTVSERDLVFITLGSMTDASTLGSTTESALLDSSAAAAPAWTLWQKIAQRFQGFGQPQKFGTAVDQTKWQSFTVTLPNSRFFQFMEAFTGNVAGTGGLVTFKDSNWLMSIVLAYQPHFLNQPPQVNVFWGYGLYPDRPGNAVGKPMSECCGAEILEELCHHLPLDDTNAQMFADANCIPCMLPYITSQFMPRSPGDRPAVRPTGANNYAFIGQFTEAPDDTVFTVEYSIRTAQMAVYSLLKLSKTITPMYRGYRQPAVVLRALRALW